MPKPLGICTTIETTPGVVVIVEITVAACPPKVTEGTKEAVPVASSVTVLPPGAGFPVPFREPSWLIAAACPLPEPSPVNSAGAAAARGTLTVLDKELYQD